MNISDIFIILPIIFFSIIIHEVSHGLMALYLGDPTARDADRLTLNPIKHIDLFGTIILPALLIISRMGIVFGWAKPVPVNPYRLKAKKGMLYVAAAGPASNFILLIISALAMRFINMMGAGELEEYLIKIFFYSAIFNGILMMFNLIPLLPLDGGRILTELLPRRIAEKYSHFERYGIIVLFLILILDNYINLQILYYILIYPVLVLINFIAGFILKIQIL